MIQQFYGLLFGPCAIYMHKVGLACKFFLDIVNRDRPNYCINL